MMRFVISVVMVSKNRQKLFVPGRPVIAYKKLSNFTHSVIVTDCTAVVKIKRRIKTLILNVHRRDKQYV